MKRLSVATLLLLVLGCGGDPIGPSDAAVSDASLDAGKGADAADAGKDASCGIFEGCGVPCPGDFKPTPLPTIAPRSDCSAQQIKTVFDGCVANTANDPACKAALAASPTCYACLFGPFATAPAAADDDGYFQLNVAACLALTSSDPTCAQRWQDAHDCAALYCSGLCVPDGDPNQFVKCVAKARAGYCASLVANECSAADAGPTAACAITSFEASFIPIASIVCAGATPPGDAGKD